MMDKLWPEGWECNFKMCINTSYAGCSFLELQFVSTLFFMLLLCKCDVFETFLFPRVTIVKSQSLVLNWKTAQNGLYRSSVSDGPCNWITAHAVNCQIKHISCTKPEIFIYLCIFFLVEWILVGDFIEGVGSILEMSSRWCKLLNLCSI